MPDVTFHRVSLTGFGLYRDPVSFTFDSARSVLVGANETGKSTLVHGILGTLFGLRRSDDPVGLTTGRFRNWDSPSGFRGTIEFTVSGTRWKLGREFDTHKVSLLRSEGTGWTAEFEGEHNPGAHRNPDARRYVDALREILGIGDRQVLESVFCVTQDPDALEPGPVSDAVQGLVAGSGRQSFDGALEGLVDSLQSITREMRGFDIVRPGTTRPTDLRRDQELEITNREIADLRAKIESSRSTLADLAGIRKRRVERQEIFKRGEEERRTVDRTLQAWNEWAGLKKDRERLEKEQAGLAEVVHTCESLRQQLGEGRKDLAKAYPEFSDAPVDLESRLEDMADLLEKKEALREEREAVESDIRESFGEDTLADEGAESLLSFLKERGRVEQDLEAKGQELQKIELLFAEARMRRWRKAAAFGLLGLVAGAVAGLVAEFGTGGFVAVIVAAGIAAGGIAFLTIRPKAADPDAVTRYKALGIEVARGFAALAPLNQRLGPLAGAGAGPLGELREKLRRLIEVSRDLADVEQGASKQTAEFRALLDAAGGDATVLRNRYSDYRERESALVKGESELAIRLEGGKTIEDLVRRKAGLDNEIQSLITTERQLRREHPSLEEAAMIEDAVELEKKHAGLRTRAERAAATIQAEDENIRTLHRDIAGLEGSEVVDVASEEIRLRELEAKRDRLTLERDAIVLAYRATKAGIDRFQSSHRERLGASVHEWFGRLTGRPARRVELDARFEPCVTESAGQTCATEQLSGGAQDQLYLAVRLAVAEFIAGDVKLPLIFDDPFLTFDRERLDILRAALREISTSRQVILLTHREELREWGKPVEITNG